MIEVLNEIKSLIVRGDQRFQIVDHEHVRDTKTGIKLHLYDDKPFKVTLNDDYLADMRDFKLDEQTVMQEIKSHIDKIPIEANRSKFINIFKGAA
jgi:hypothetical protein